MMAWEEFAMYAAMIRVFGVLGVAVLVWGGCSDGSGTSDPSEMDTGTSSGDDVSSNNTMDTAMPDTAMPDTAMADTAEPTDTGSADVPDEDTGSATQIEQPPASGSLLAGVGVEYLDGPVGISMAGFGGRSGQPSSWSGSLKASQGCYGRMVAKAMVLEVEGERLAIVKMPTMSGEHSLTEGIDQALRELYDIDLAGRIITGATHSHHAQGRYWRLPDSLAVVGADSPDEEAIALYSRVFAAAIKEAIDDLGPAQWGFAFQDDWDPDDRIYRDRRSENNPEYSKDPRLSLLAVQRPDGTPLATVINFGIHGTVFDDDNDLLTEDSVGGIEMKFEEHFFAEEGQPVVGMFIQAGAGDASPAGDALGHPEPARIEKLGEDAAPMILELYRTLEWSSQMTLAVRSRRIDLTYEGMGYDTYPEFLDPSGEPYTWGGWQCSGTEGAAKLCVPVSTLLEGLGEPIPHGELHQTYLTVARLDGLLLISLPGEPVASIIRYLREEVAKRSTEALPLESMAFGYSQDHLLYLTHPDDWFAGGYESEMSVWGPLAGKYLVDRQMELAEQMLDGFNGPSFYEESPGLSPAKPFEPRALEASLEPGTLLDDPGGAVYPRTSVVSLTLAAGDPTLGSPTVDVQVQVEEGTFEDVPNPSGHPGMAYDNSRYEMLTLYQPEPPMSRDILAERHHDWTIQWQVPEDWPAGTYRFRAHGTWWDGSTVQDWELTTTPFEVVQAEGALLEVEPQNEGMFALRLSLPSVAYRKAPERSWPAQGWRLLDRQVSPEERPTVKAPIWAVLVDDEGQAVSEPQTLMWDMEARAHMFALVDPPAAAVAIQVRLAADRVPASVEAPLPALNP
ncbi:MAG: neutral/alkaline non-lysosomal ceramidase N-terminal domain-containing protein [Myxococcota bacterium]